MSATRIDIKKLFPRVLIFTVIGLVVGFYVLEEVATWEKLPPGQVFYILLGCVLIAISGVILLVAMKLRFFPKKRKKKGNKPVFLEDLERKKKKNPENL